MKQRKVVVNFTDGKPTEVVLVESLREFEAHGMICFVHRAVGAKTLVCSESSTGWSCCVQQNKLHHGQTIRGFTTWAKEKMLNMPKDKFLGAVAIATRSNSASKLNLEEI